jgi:hypothetical protein
MTLLHGQFALLLITIEVTENDASRDILYDGMINKIHFSS